jgi:hypothetical protein
MWAAPIRIGSLCVTTELQPPADPMPGRTTKQSTAA